MTEALSNNPPPHAELLDRLQATAEEGSRIPCEFGPDLAPRVIDWLRKAGLLLGDAEAARKAEKEPFLTGGRRVDAEWLANTAVLSVTVDQVRSRLVALDLPKQVRGEHGAVASFTPLVVRDIDDWSAIPLEPLRPYLDEAAIGRAVSLALRAGVEIPGVRTSQRRTVTIR